MASPSQPPTSMAAASSITPLAAVKLGTKPMPYTPLRGLYLWEKCPPVNLAEILCTNRDLDARGAFSVVEQELQCELGLAEPSRAHRVCVGGAHLRFDLRCMRGRLRCASWGGE